MVERCQLENILTMNWLNDIVWKIFRPLNGRMISYDICLTMRLGKHYEFLTIFIVISSIDIILIFQCCLATLSLFSYAHFIEGASI